MTDDDQALGDQRWQDAALAAACIAVGGHALGGVRVRSRAGPVRDEWLRALRALYPKDTPWRKVPVGCASARLLGGLDLAATLQGGALVAERGLLAEVHEGVALLAMAERTSAQVIGILCSVLDAGEVTVEREGVRAQYLCRPTLVALDEGVDDEALVETLRDRLAIEIVLDDIGIASVDDFPWSHVVIEDARSCFSSVIIEDQQVAALCRAADAFGLSSPRVSLLAARVARALAALDRRTSVEESDLEVALRLTVIPRATRLPQAPEAEATEEAQQDESPPEDTETNEAEEPEDRPAAAPGEAERLLEAAKAQLPEDLLAQLMAKSVRRGGAKSSGKSGAQQRHKLRGRPMGSVAGDPRRGGRMDVIGTLRAAAPWQRLRPSRAGRSGLAIQSDDFRIVRYRQRSQSVTIFVVDASGSSALYRLAEAKGAVELLLSESYVRRDEVALIAFRGSEAELLLPPTRSLVRAKRALSALPGGGGTPLASALQLTGEMVEQLERRGSTPSYVVFTDGRANVSRDGSKGREVAIEDAQQAARHLRLQSSVSGLVIDTSPRPHRTAEELASALGARYLPLPNADAEKLQMAIRRVAA
ncbi:MAG: magnesium chelatase subunit D [Pseudomonadota bacterium]